MAFLAGIITIGYLALIASQGHEDDLVRVALVATTIAGAGGAAWVGGAVGDGRIRAAALGLATGILLGLGYLALFSIGIFLVVAGVLAAVASSIEVSRSGHAEHAVLGFDVGVGSVLLPFLLAA